MKRFSRVFLFALAIMLVAFVGCAEPRGQVSGKVTYLDKPVTGGTVIFMTEDTPPKQDQVQIQKDGTYSSTNVPLGKIRVGVMPAPKGLKASMPQQAKGGGKMPNEAPADKEDPYKKDGSDYVDIPEKLRNPETSMINLNVERGAQTFDIILKK